MGSAWTNSGRFHVGGQGSFNRMIVSNGGVLDAASSPVAIGDNSSARSNSVWVTGLGSLWRARELLVGFSGAVNELMASDGARLELGRVAIGQNCTASENLAVIVGAGTYCTNSTLIVGGCGSNNRLVIEHGALMDSGSVASGNQGGGGNEIWVTGSNALWRIADTFTLGKSGAGDSLNVSYGGKIHSGAVTIGGAARDTLAWLVGAGAAWSNASLVVGEQGSNNLLVIQTRAAMESDNVQIGSNSQARDNAALVIGTGAIWTIHTSLVVGSFGQSNRLFLDLAGRVFARDLFIGLSNRLSDSSVSSASGNLVSVRGAATLAITNALVVGHEGTDNRLEIHDGGRALIGANSASPPGSLCGPEPGQNKLIVDGGCLAVTNAGFVSALNVRYGTLILNRGVIEIRDFRIHNGPFGRMEFQGGTLRTINALVRGVPLDVGDGFHSAVLEVNGNDSGFELLNIKPGGVLHVAKALHSTILTNAGTVAPGGADSLRAYVEGTITQLPEGILSFDIGGRAQGSNYAFLTCSGSILLNGSLHLRLRGGFVPAAGDFFEILRTSALVGACTNAPHGGRLKTLDNLGSFLVSYSPTNIVLSDYQSTDLDGDVIEDAWATNYLGHSPLTPAEKLADVDGDGAGNGEEFRAGTDPTNPGSVFKAVIQLTGDSASVTFDCVDGKTYRVWFSNDLQSWVEVPDPTFAFPRKGRCQWLDDGKDTTGKPVAPRFYRLMAE